MLKKLFVSKTPKAVIEAERQVIDAFEFVLEAQLIVIEIVAKGDLYEVWLNECKIYQHLALHKVYKKALYEVEKINSKINNLEA